MYDLFGERWFLKDLRRQVNPVHQSRGNDDVVALGSSDI